MLQDAQISVVIPTYNRAELLASTLDTVIRQSVAPLEIIVVDDGSTDATDLVLDRYAAKGVRKIKVENSGHLVARNVGLRAARGDLVAFCDSDDLWRTTFLETALRLWRLAPSTQVAYANFAIVQQSHSNWQSKFDAAPMGFWNELRPVGPGLGIFEHPFAHRLVDFQPFFPSCMVVDRLAFLHMGGWDEAVTGIIGSDFATAMQVAERPPVGIMLEALVGIRKHDSNLSGDTQTMNLGNARILEHALRTMPSMRPWEKKIRCSIAARRCDALASAFVRHDHDAVRAIYDLLAPEDRPLATMIKAAFAAMPQFVARHATDAALALGTSKASVLTAAAAYRAMIPRSALSGGRQAGLGTGSALLRS